MLVGSPEVRNQPRLSVVVTITGGSYHLPRCLDALHRQHGASPAEILVPVFSWEDFHEMREIYPDVRFVTITSTGPARHCIEHLAYDQRRAVGLSAATGDIIAMTEDHAVVAHDWCSRILSAHRQPYGAVGGSVHDACRSIVNSAVFFVDFGRYQHPMRGPAAFITDINVSYKRSALEKVRDVWETLYHETWVHEALRERGEIVWLEPAIMVHHDRGEVTLRSLLIQRFEWARLYAGRRAAAFSASTRAAYTVLSPLLPLLLIARQFLAARSHLSTLSRLLATLPVLCLLTTVAAFGELVGYATARAVGSNHRSTTIAVT
jgi:hypothetical protein